MPVGLAKPDDDPADRVTLAEVDVGLGDIAFEALVTELVMDHVPIELGLELPARACRYRAADCRRGYRGPADPAMK